MKVKLVRRNGSLYLLCNDGTIAKATETILKQLFLCFSESDVIKGKDGRWKTDDSKTMEKCTGTTIAWVDDSGVLCIKENPFLFLTEDVTDSEYITAIEYAELHNKNVARIKKLCVEGRINGATKKAGKWFIPKNSPYPKDARYSGVDK